MAAILAEAKHSVALRAIDDPRFLCPNCAKASIQRPIIYELAGETSDLAQCEHCGLFHLFPVPSQERIHSFYGDRSAEMPGYYYYPTDPTFYDAVLHDAKKKFASARRHMTGLPEKVRLLDIGCGSGAFVKAVSDLGLRAIGSDFSAASVEAGRRTFNIDLRTVGRDDDPGSNFDIVSFWEVLEHAPDLRAFLANVRSRLKPGGYAIGSVPHWGSIAHRLGGSRWGMILVPGHISYFTRASLTDAFVRNGFTVDFLGTTPLFATPHWTTGIRRWMHARRDVAKNVMTKQAWLTAIRLLTKLKRLSYRPSNTLLCAIPAFADHLLFVVRRTP